jgi:hypothetical protein
MRSQEGGSQWGSAAHMNLISGTLKRLKINFTYLNFFSLTKF